MKESVEAFLSFMVGLRKFVVMLILYTVGMYMKFSGQLTGAELVTLLKSTTIAFFGANGIEHISTTARHIFGKGSNNG